MNLKHSILIGYLLICGACNQTAHTPSQVNLITAITNARGEVEKSLSDTYEKQALEAIDSTPNVVDALNNLIILDLSWESTWDAWSDLRNQHDACLISAQLCNEELLATTWCDFGAIARIVNIKIPDIISGN